MRTNKLSLLVVLVGLVAIGCEQSQVARVDPAGGKYLLKTEPADPQTPTVVKETIGEPTRMVVAGRVDAGDIEPFQDGLASFVMTQLPSEAHAGGDPDHVDNCPFCQREIRNAPKAIVRILDEAGEVMSVDARELLGVSKGDVVVVEGLVTYLEPVNTVQIDAEGIFIR